MPSPDLNDLRAKLLAPKPGTRRGGQAPDPLSDFPSESSRRFALAQKLAGYRKDLAGRLRMPRLDGLRLPDARGLLAALEARVRNARPEHVLGGTGVVLGCVALMAILWIVLLASDVPTVAAPAAFAPPGAAALTPTAPEIERAELRPTRTPPRIRREPGDVELSAPTASTSGSASRPRPGADNSLAGARPMPKVDEVVYADFGAGSTSASADLPAGDADPNRVYTASDADVRPPVPVRAWFHISPPEGVSRASLSQVEVVVSASGEVVSVRMVAGPRTYADSAALSAIKAGRFKPAVKDGRPVSYRQTVWIKVPER